MKKISNDSTNFVDVTEIISDAILEVRYNTTYNFIGTRIDGYLSPKVFLTKEAALALKKVSDEVIQKGYRLKLYDGYRPQRAVDHFVRWSNDLDDIAMKPYFYPDRDKSKLFEEGYIAKDSSHSRGSTIDLTLLDMSTGKDLDMGSPFDYFGKRSHLNHKHFLSNEQIANRKLLCDTMVSHGFMPIETEWWHYTLKNEPYPDTYFNFVIK